MNASTGASIVQYNTNSVHNTSLCKYSNNKSDSFKVLVKTILHDATTNCNLLDNGKFGEHKFKLFSK